MRKPRIKSFNFIRTLCALGIIVYHFSCHLNSKDFLPLYSFENGLWGDVFVTVFFVVSGASLYYQYADNWNTNTVKSYLYKRWKSIFPMYYIAYLNFEIQKIISHKNPLFRGNPLRYVFTLLGMDGYLTQVTTTYYTLGEWFTGAIIILYILFPIILWCILKNYKVTFLMVLFLYIIFLNTPILNPVVFWSITSCLVSFVCGMILMKYRKFLLNKWCFLGNLIVFIVLCFIELPLRSNVSTHVIGLCLFEILFFGGEYICKINFLDLVFTELSNISYAVFLLQHIAIGTVLAAWNPSNPLKIIILEFCTIIWILCQAKVLTLVTNAVVKKIEFIVLRKKQE